MRKDDLPKIFRPFFEESDLNSFSTLREKNAAYARNLIVRGEGVRQAVLTGIEKLKHGIPDDPNGSFASFYVFDTAVMIVGAEGANLFAEMLNWPWVIAMPQNHSVLLRGARLGGRENLQLLQEFCRQIIVQKGKTPAIKELLAQAGKAMAACLLRGFSDIHSSRVCQSELTEFPDCTGYVR